MKKIIALLLALALMVSVAPAVFASTTTLTTTVPTATYTLNIPADQQIPFGTTKFDIGNVTVTESSGFAVGKDLNVTVTYDAFKCADTTTEIPYTLKLYAQSSSTTDGTEAIPSGSIIVFNGQSSGKVNEFAKINVYNSSGGSYGLSDVDNLFLSANSADWGKALAGEYTSTITFTAEVVQETD